MSLSWSLDWQALSDSVRGLYRMAEKLSSTVLELRKGPCRGESKIYVVAHSAGGLVARYYIQLLGGFHYCDGLITLGTPHQGTWIAVLGLFCHLILKARCLIQMLPVSPFIKHLNTADFPGGFKIVCISSPDDFLCPPKATRMPVFPGEEDRLEAIQLNGLSHGGFLVNKRCYHTVLRHLTEGLPEPIQATDIA